MNEEQSLERALSVVQTLHRRARAGKVNWEQSFAYPGAFQADVGGIVVVIQRTEDPEYPDLPDYRILVIQKSVGHVVGNQGEIGKIIEEISNNTLRPLRDRTTEEGLTPYYLLSETFEMARRKALHVDEVLDGLIQKLEGPGE